MAVNYNENETPVAVRLTDGRTITNVADLPPELRSGSSSTPSKSNQNSQVSNIFRYPFKKLTQSEDYLKIECLEYIPPGVNESATSFNQPSSDQLYNTTGKQKIRGTIILPIPENIPLNGTSVSWGESTLNAGQTLGLSVAESTIKSGISGFLKSIGNAAGTIKDASMTGRGQKLIQNYFASKTVEQVFGQDSNLFGTLLGRTTGAVFNENVELLFRGITLRDAFSFQFEIAPRFEKESEEVRQMIIFLKREMSARKGNTSGPAAGLFLTAPSVFRLQYMSGGGPHPYLNTFKICALRSLSVNFNGSNTYATYSDGTPVHMQLGLTFQELTPIYDVDYNNPVGTGY